MFKTAAETSSFFAEFNALVNGSDKDVVLFPTFVNIPAAVAAVAGTRIEIGGQNLYWEKEGAFTGEISGPILVSAGAKWVLIGHSERRQYFFETDETVLKRTRAALEAGLRPVVCVGEKLEEREAQETEMVLERQFRVGIGPLTADEFAGIVIAYEPVWAIGTGKTATPEMAEEAHRFLRVLAEKKFGPVAANGLRLLYGGSVKPDNASALLGQPNIDGALVGGASLQAASFAAIVNA